MESGNIRVKRPGKEPGKVAGKVAGKVPGKDRFLNLYPVKLYPVFIRSFWIELRLLVAGIERTSDTSFSRREQGF